MSSSLVAPSQETVDSVVSRAREVNAIENPDATRRFVLELMGRQEWSTEALAGPLAEAWGLSPRSVENIATECGRWSRIILGAQSQSILRDRIVLKAHEVMDRVRSPKQFAAVARAVFPLAGIHDRGAGVAVQVNVGGSGATLAETLRAQLGAGATDAQVVALARDYMLALAELVARLGGSQSESEVVSVEAEQGQEEDGHEQG